ncbi:gp36 [Klebsiella michiganensis]|uniref:Gp36 n=1 Tax=Klebsiella michiganensis TaxID=1134687 RepID=A0A7H4MYM7_9ENTR|nr:gp36 [Klebsiella michiganensis]
MSQRGEMYNEAISIAVVFRAVVPGSHKRRRPIDEIAAAIRKVLDDRFWNRCLLKYATRWREHLRISLGDVRRSISPYCSKERVNIWRERRQRSREILGGLEIEDKETGERFSLLEQIDKSTSNPEKRRVELMTRIGGFEKAANEWGYVGSYFTITTPSKYHAYTAFGHRNGKWQGSSPRDSQKYLNTIWQQIRAELAREEIGVFGLRVAEPHHDGTPHWHGVLFTLPEHQNALCDVLQRYATREDAGELATKHGIHPRFDFG